MVKTYILAPNWTTAPPPKGPIKLGHVLDDLTELVPINRKGVVETDELLNKVDTKNGFMTSRSKLITGELGIFAKVVGLVGVGAAAGVYYKKDKDDVLSCKTLDTVTFDPTTEYITRTMDLPEVKNFMQGSKFKAPVYLVTGLKIGRGASLRTSSSQDKGVKLDGGLSAPGYPIEVGGEGGAHVRKKDGESWDGSTPFIVAFRVRKVWYRHGDIKHKAHNRNVVMQDGTLAQEAPDVTLQTDDVVPLSDLSDVESTHALHQDLEDGDEVVWIIPNVEIESA